MEHEANNFGAPTELPQPQEAGGHVIPEQAGSALPETRGKQMPSMAPPTQQPTQAPISDDPQALQPVAPTSAPAQGSAPTSSLIADDTDLIEKEWVTRAKAIVMHTKDDPHTQNREMNKVKADYLKKRYNKDLKVNES